MTVHDFESCLLSVIKFQFRLQFNTGLVDKVV